MSSTIVGYALVRISDGAIEQRYAVADLFRVNDAGGGGYIWVKSDWSDELRRIVPVIIDEPTTSPLQTTVEGAPYYDGNNVYIPITVNAVTTNEANVIIDNVAARAILAKYPDWKQRNMTARGVELLSKLVAGEQLTVGEQAEMAVLQADWSWIKSVRSYSDALQAAYISNKTIDVITGVIDGVGQWPE